jgi:hypothetical protein
VCLIGDSSPCAKYPWKIVHIAKQALLKLEEPGHVKKDLHCILITVSELLHSYFGLHQKQSKIKSLSTVIKREM